MGKYGNSSDIGELCPYLWHIGRRRSRSTRKPSKTTGWSLNRLTWSLSPEQSPANGSNTVPVLNILVALLLFVYLANVFMTSPMGPLAALDLNTYNLIFISVGLLLHWRPKRFLRAVAQSVPASGGVLIQFPFYAVIFGMIAGTGINKWLADIFVSVTTQNTYPLLVAFYSAVLGVFIPSGGSKWVIEATYVLAAANELKVHFGMGGSDL